MEFAQQRDEERESNVRRYRQQEEQEKARDTKKPDRHASFIQSVFQPVLFSCLISSKLTVSHLLSQVVIQVHVWYNVRLKISSCLIK